MPFLSIGCDGELRVCTERTNKKPDPKTSNWWSKQYGSEESLKYFTQPVQQFRFVVFSVIVDLSSNYIRDHVDQEPGNTMYYNNNIKFVT